MTRKRNALPQEVFLSHSAKDRRFAEKIAQVLRRHGIPVWYSGTNIVGASQWHDEIGNALQRCDWLLVVLSPHSVKSPWVKHELVYALSHARYETRIVPVLFKPCNHLQLSWTLGEYQFVDFTTDFRQGCRRLLRIWGLGYQAESR
jgi:hypothetical protein